MMIYNDGKFYEGLWENDKRNGFGILKNEKGQVVYQGTWMEDLYHGRGVEINLN